MSRLLTFACFALALRAYAQTTGEVIGSVVDARGGEALARVEILLGGGPYRTTTGDDGKFRLPGLAPGDYVLNASTVGYHLVRKPFHLDAGGTVDFEIVLSPDTFHQTDTVEGQASPFDAARSDSPGALVLASGTAFALSELADFAVYTPLQRRRLTLAVVVSSVVGLTVDSVVFLTLAFGSLAFLPGQIVGKLWAVAIAVPLVRLLRRVAPTPA